MRAARFYDRGDIRIDEINEPIIKAGQVGIDVAWCGICGTDLHEFLDGPIFCPSAEHPNPITGEVPPVTLGHEMSGVVNFIGEGISGLKVGDHVVVEPYIVPEGTDTSETGHYTSQKAQTLLVWAEMVEVWLKKFLLMNVGFTKFLITYHWRKLV